MAIPSWIHLNKTQGSGNDTITVTVDSNSDTSNRSYKLSIVSSSGLSSTINISQSGIKSLKTIIFPNASNRLNFTNYEEMTIAISPYASYQMASDASNRVEIGTINTQAGNTTVYCDSDAISALLNRILDSTIIWGLQPYLYVWIINGETMPEVKGCTSDDSENTLQGDFLWGEINVWNTNFVQRLQELTEGTIEELNFDNDVSITNPNLQLMTAAPYTDMLAKCHIITKGNVTVRDENGYMVRRFGMFVMFLNGRTPYYYEVLPTGYLQNWVDNSELSGEFMTKTLYEKAIAALPDTEDTKWDTLYGLVVAADDESTSDGITNISQHSPYSIYNDYSGSQEIINGDEAGVDLENIYDSNLYTGELSCNIDTGINGNEEIILELHSDTSSVYPYDFQIN